MKAGSKAGWIAGLMAAAAAAWAIRDYAKWRSLGPGGLPANPGGWLSMMRFRWMAKDGLDVTQMMAAAGGENDLQAWRDIRRRAGARPTVSPYPIPHRQLDQLADPGVRGQLSELFDRTVDRHAGRVLYALSSFEKRHPAITLTCAEGSVGAASNAEIAHIHPSDNSMHMVLSPSDAVAAIEMGWAQRHGLAGVAAGLPPTYVMVYSPRNREDLAVVEQLLEAAIAYAIQPVRSESAWISLNLPAELFPARQARVYGTCEHVHGALRR
jgi:hypothetical protein